ncbi:MAG: PsbP-related protein [Chlamydiales bacterium]|nr:PsbP-related protein [Chlamydiales bacterium]
MLKAFSLILMTTCTIWLTSAYSEELQFEKYTNKDGCYSVDFPKSWSIIPDEDDVSAVSPAENEQDKAFESVEIWVETLDEPRGLDEYFPLSLENLKKHYTKFEVVGEGSELLDKVPSRWFRAKITRGNVQGEVLQYQMIIDQRVYIINFTADPSAYSRFETIFNRITSSFRFTCD